MATRTSRSWREWLPHAFPFFACLVTVTALVQANPNEGVTLENLVIPSYFAVMVPLVLWTLAGVFGLSRLRRSLVVLWVALFCLTSGYWVSMLESMTPGSRVPVLLETGFAISVLVIVLIAILRWMPDDGRVARFSNLLAGLLLLSTLPAVLGLADADDSASLPTSGLSVEMMADTLLPDIYLIVLDGYSGEASLRDLYDFDNGRMVDSLRARGFAFPALPRSNYTKTFLSVGSMLNREYVDELVVASAPDYADRGAAYDSLEYNRTVRDLKALGYAFVFAGSSYPPLARNRLADVQYSTTVSRQFERLWLSQTIVSSVRRLLCVLGDCADPLPFIPESALETEDRVAWLKAQIDRPSPKFVYAHWLLPHGPFRFDADCSRISPRWTVGPDALTDDQVERRLYVDHVMCTNKKVLELVDVIRAAQRSEPVIILQSDHGYGRFPGDKPPPLEQARSDQVRERFGVFAAYAGPGSLEDSLASFNTPVNLFRTLFRSLWGLDEPPLNEIHFWSDTDRSFALTVVAPDDLGRQLDGVP